MDGVLAGMAGTSALNVVTYLDMVVRARPASSVPEETVRRLADAASVDLGAEPRAANRRSGLGPLLGYAAGVGTAVAFAALAPRRLPLTLAAGLIGAGAMLAADTPITALRLTDPRRWSAGDWAADIIPHLVYGLTTAAAWRRLRQARSSRC
jgi:hypothetical protein